MIVPLSWNEYQPDLDPATPGNITDMGGTFISEKGVRTFPGLARAVVGLPAQCYGVFGAYLLGTPVLVAATASGLYVASGGTFQQQVGGLLNTSNRWRFAAYGQDLIGVDGVDVPYYYRNSASGILPNTGAASGASSIQVNGLSANQTIPAGASVAIAGDSTNYVTTASRQANGSGTIASLPVSPNLTQAEATFAPVTFTNAPGLGTWQPLPGSPPVASLVTTTDYAVILVPPNSQTLYSNLSDTAPWVPNAASEVYQYDLAQIEGNITSVQRKRAYLAVYRANAIQSAYFVGGEIGWDFGNPGTISLTVGAAGNECVINTGDYDYLVGPDDFWSFDGYNLSRIPNHVKEWFFRDLNRQYQANIAGRYDITRDLVIWHYPSNSTARGQAGLLDSYIGFYQRPNPPRWFYGRLPVELPLQSPAPDPSFSPSQAQDSGLVLPSDHCLYFYNELNAFNPVGNSVFVTSQDFGDPNRQFVWEWRRLRPGFTQYPYIQQQGGTGQQTPNPAAKVIPLVQMTNTGTTPVAKAPSPLSGDGWFNRLVSGRLTRFMIVLNGIAELTQGHVDGGPTGEV